MAKPVHIDTQDIIDRAQVSMKHEYPGQYDRRYGKQSRHIEDRLKYLASIGLCIQSYCQKQRDGDEERNAETGILDGIQQPVMKLMVKGGVLVDKYFKIVFQAYPFRSGVQVPLRKRNINSRYSRYGKENDKEDQVRRNE